MATENSATSPFLGMWEIIESSLGEKSYPPDLKGVKFRLDENSDIIWYNDVFVYSQELFSPAAAAAAATESPSSENHSSGGGVFNELANILLACESFDIVTGGGGDVEETGLSFSTYAGQTIEFKTPSSCPGDSMTLNCDGLYRITCKRVKEGEAIGQPDPFSLICALQEGYFTDVIIKSSDGLYFEAHSVILRLNGFDCSMNFTSDLLPNASTDCNSPPAAASAAGAAAAATALTPGGSIGGGGVLQGTNPSVLATNHFLLPPPSSTGCFGKKGLTGSFNCLSTSPNLLSPPNAFNSHHSSNSSSSDSDIRQSCNNRKEVFNFTTPILPMTPPDSFIRSTPLSSPRFTPPTSPLTPISILYNLPCSILKPIIYWLYTEAVSPNLSEEVCEKLMLLSEQTPPLNKMTNQMRRYLKKMRLKKYIIDLSMDIHGYLNRIITHMTPRRVSHDPRHLCSVFADSLLRELCVGCAKILDFCNIFVRDASHLTRFQRHEIIKYTRSRVPIFLKQWHQILVNIFEILSSLSSAEKADLAVYLVPQIEKTLDQFRSIALDVKTSLEMMYEHLKSNGTKGGARGGGGGAADRGSSQSGGYQNHATYRNKFGESENDLTFFLYMYEVRKTRDIYGRIKSAYETIDQNRFTFVEMSQMEKERTIRRNLDFLLLEFPSYIKRLESLECNFDSNVGWKEFKFCFKLGTGQINGVISKLVEHKGALHSSILRICDLVQRRDFVYTMTNLGMLDKTSSSSASSSYSSSPQPPPISPDFSLPHDMPRVDYKSIKLNLVKHLCESPNILYSNLSKNALRLLHSGEMSDMEFEVISCAPFAQSNRSAFLANQLPKVHIFRAHRAIVCSRCEYFRRALLSGMKEDIDRKIIVQDTSPVIFRRFLLYLYGAPIDKTVSADQICELMLLGDRYLPGLKDICEQILKSQIDEDSVICLLSIADRFNANTLKSNCLAFISNRMHLIKQELFVELGAKLQEEVYELIRWRSRTPQPWNSNRGGAGAAAEAVNGETKPKIASSGDGRGGEGAENGSVSTNNSHHSSARLPVPAVASSGGASSSVSSPPSSAASRSPNRASSGTATSAAAATSPFM